MKKSARFPSAVHILTMLAARPDSYLSSELIAQSMGTNRVVALRLIALLAKADLVTSLPGVQGGTKLARKPQEIRLLDIYHAVEDGTLFKLHSPHPNCPVGRSVTRDLTEVLQQAEAALEKKLAGQTLARSMKAGIEEMQRFLNSRKK